MADNKPTHIMVHAKQYMAANGKLQHVKAGTPLTLTAKQAEAFGDKVKPFSQAEVVDPAKAEAEAKAKAEAKKPAK